MYESEAEMVLENLLGSSKKSKRPHLFIFIDAMDKLSVEGNNNLVNIFLRAKNPSVKLICSQIKSFDDPSRTGFRMRLVDNASGILQI